MASIKLFNNDRSYLLLCKMFLILLLSFPLFAVFKLYMFILLVRYLLVCVLVCGRNHFGMMELVVGFV